MGGHPWGEEEVNKGPDQNVWCLEWCCYVVKYTSIWLHFETFVQVHNMYLGECVCVCGGGGGGFLGCGVWRFE